MDDLNRIKQLAGIDEAKLPPSELEKLRGLRNQLAPTPTPPPITAQVPDQLSPEQQKEIDNWEKDVEAKFATSHPRAAQQRMASLGKPVDTPTVDEPAAQPAQSYSELKSKHGTLDKLIDVKTRVETLAKKAEAKWGPLPPGIKADIDDSVFASNDYESMLQKNEKALESLLKYMGMKSALYGRKKPMREGTDADMINKNLNENEELMRIRQLAGLAPVVVTENDDDSWAEKKAEEHDKNKDLEDESEFDRDEPKNLSEGAYDQLTVTIPNPNFNAEDDDSSEEIDVYVQFSVSGTYVPARVQYDDYDHPAEYPDVDIDSIVDDNGQDMSKLIDDKTYKYINDQIWEHLDNYEEDFYESSEQEITDDMVRAAYEKRHQAFVNNSPDKHSLADYASMLANKYAQQQSMKNNGHGFDPITGNALEEKFDLNNGYETKVANGEDYFPDGADSPVTTRTGPSGARQGDNPEQKKMEVAEAHKELVYNYRKFLKESAKK